MARPAFRPAARRAEAPNELASAAALNDFDEVRRLLPAYKGRLDETDAAGRTALLRALENNNEEIALLLLHHGADRDRAAANGVTPLMIACEKRMSGAVERLVTQGARLDAQEKASGDTALMKAVRGAHPWAACRLIDAGADTKQANHAGETAATLAPLYLDGQDLGFFTAALRQARTAADEAARAERARVVAENCALPHDITPLKTITLRPRPPK